MSGRPIYEKLTRQFDGPLEDKSSFDSMSDFLEYIQSDTTAYSGQICFVEGSGLFVLTKVDGALVPISIVDENNFAQHDLGSGKILQFSTLNELVLSIEKHGVRPGSLCFVGNNETGDLYIIVDEGEVKPFNIVDYFVKKSEIENMLDDVLLTIDDKLMNFKSDIKSMSQHQYDHLVEYEHNDVNPNAIYLICDPYGEIDKIYNGFELVYHKYPLNVVVFLSDEPRSITPNYENIMLQYTTNKGIDWVDIESGEETYGSREIWFRGKVKEDAESGLSYTKSFDILDESNKLRVKGDLMFLICDELGDEIPRNSMYGVSLSSMFRGCGALIEAPQISATTMYEQCYHSLFEGCKNLTEAPILPALILAVRCYLNMFTDCIGLKQTPYLPALDLSNATMCYANMFEGCTNLTVASDLNATILSTYCCFSMFYNCINLIEPPTLPAMTLADLCYINMFNGCSSLEEIVLPATTLADTCYINILVGCDNLKRVYLGYEGDFDCNYFGGWLPNVSGTIYKAGQLFLEPGGCSHVGTWTQVPWEPVVEGGDQSC